MRKIILLCISFIGLVSCLDQKETFGITDIIKGQQWNLKIGSSPGEVYKQLQELGEKKGFDDITLVGESGKHFPLYNAVTILTPKYGTDSVYIEFKDEKVASIKRWRNSLLVLEEWFDDETGEVPIPFVPGHLMLKTDILKNWPEETLGSSIKLGDHVDKVSEKFGEILDSLRISNRPIVLSEQNLEKAYEPEIAKYTQWEFFFPNIIEDVQAGRYSIRLYFDNDKLEKIRKEYR